MLGKHFLKRLVFLKSAENDFRKKKLTRNKQISPLTQVLASVPIEQQSRFRDQKGTTTQNILARKDLLITLAY